MKMGMSRRKFGVLATALAGGSLGVLASACGATGASGTDSGQAAAPAPVSSQPVKITWWSNLGDQHPESVARLQVINDFNAASKPVEVVPEAFGANLTKIKTAIAGDTPPDTYFIAWREGAEVFLTGAVADLDAEMKSDKQWTEQRKDMFPQMLATSTWKGKLTSMPIYTNDSTIIWNTDLLKKAGIADPKTGWTWDDFKETAKRAGNPPDVWGFELWADSSAFWNWYGTTGGRLLDQSGKKITIGSPEAKETMQLLLDLGRIGVSPPERISKSRSQLFINGGSVFEDTGPYRMANIRDGGVKFSVVSRPVHPKKKVRSVQEGGHNLVVTKIKDAAKLRAGLALAKYMNKGSSQAKICTALGTSIPVSQSALQSKEILDYAKQDPQWKLFADEAPYGDRSPTLPSIVKILAVLDTAINDVLGQKSGIDAAFDSANREMQQLLDADLA